MLLLLRTFIFLFWFSLKKILIFVVYNPLSSFLIAIRYALEQGAQAYAIDIEDAEHDAFTGNLASVQATKHQILRRNEAKFLDKDHTGLSLVVMG